MRSAITEQLFENTDVRLPDFVIEEIFVDHETLLGEIREWGSNDTSVRGQLSDELAQYLVGRDWPDYLEGQAAFAAFEKALYQSAQEHGYQLGQYARKRLIETNDDSDTVELDASTQTLFLAKNRHGVASSLF